MNLPSSADVLAAWRVIAPLLPRSPLVPAGTTAGGSPLLLKAESLMPTGSFKIRGATHVIAQLDAAQRARGVVAYSTGNHAQAVGKAAADAGVRATVVMSPDAPAAKIDATRGYGAEVVMAPPESQSRRLLAERLARERGAVLVPPYDDARIVAGQGTIAVELLEQLGGVRPAAVYVPVGGGGLISGIATALAQLSPGTRVVGVEPELEDDAGRSWTAGEICSGVPSASIADAVKVQRIGELTFALMRRHVHAMRTVTEQAMARAALECFDRWRLVVEPAGALGLAAAREDGEGPGAQPVVVIASGGNTSLDALQALRAMA